MSVRIRNDLEGGGQSGHQRRATRRAQNLPGRVRRPDRLELALVRLGRSGNVVLTTECHHHTRRRRHVHLPADPAHAEARGRQLIVP